MERAAGQAHAGGMPEDKPAMLEEVPMRHVMQSRPMVTQGCGLRSGERGPARFDDHESAPVDDARFDNLRRRCPTCGELGLRIVYGYPSDSLLSAAEHSKLILGGCTHSAMTHRCQNGHQWHAPDARW